MRQAFLWVMAVLLGGTLTSCGGGGGAQGCSMNDPAQLGQSSWPKFRHDAQNTGHVENAAVQTNPGLLRWAFPPLGQPAKGSFIASPAINAPQPTATEKRSVIYIGSNDGVLYAVFDDGTQNTGFQVAAGTPITSTAVVAVRDGADAVYVGTSSGLLYGLTSTGAAQPTSWPTGLSGVISASPTLGLDGTLYAASQAGDFEGVCVNGVASWSFTATAIESSPAIGPDGTLYFGAGDGFLRALVHSSHYQTGLLQWKFSTSQPIRTAPVIDVQTNSIYVADAAGHVYKVGFNGQQDTNFRFSPAAGPIYSSPALAGSHLYFGSEDGNLYALDKLTGHTDWTFPIGNDVVSAPSPASSPAVATNGSNPPVVVVGSKNGNVYFLQDNGSSAVSLVPPFSIGAPIHSSPAIGPDGTVYIGADDGRLYAIGTPRA